MEDSDSNVIHIRPNTHLRAVEETEPFIVTEMGALTRMLVLGGENETEDFLAGMGVGAILERLQQAQLHVVDYKEIAPMPAPMRFVGTVEKIAQFMRAAVSFTPCMEADDMVWCSFENLGAVLNLV